MMPMVDGLQASLETFGKSLDSKSSVSLDVQQWRISGMLSSFKRCFGHLVSGFEVDIFDRMQTYQDQTKIANSNCNHQISKL